MRIVLSGSHAVGKTSLLNLLTIPGHKKIPEMPRQVIYEWGQLPHEMTPERFLEFQLELSKRQATAEQGGDFVADRGLYDFMAYARDLSDASMVKQVDDYILKMVDGYDYIFYIPIEFALAVDDVRKNSRAYQEEIDRRLIKIYQDLNISYITISGSIENRLAQVYRVIKLA
ncbi:MAG: ATP-binding protein [bacterium]